MLQYIIIRNNYMIVFCVSLVFGCPDRNVGRQLLTGRAWFLNCSDEQRVIIENELKISHHELMVCSILIGSVEGT